MADIQLQKIAGLSRRLQSLGNKSRGMPIEAEDWNSLVTVLQGLLEIDRTQQDLQDSALSEKFAQRDHPHLGEVSLAWLDADLQARLGGATTPTHLLERLSQLDARITSLTREVARLTASTTGLQATVDRFSVRDLDRTQSLRDFESRIGTLGGLQTNLSSLSAELGSVKTNLQSVLQLRQSLTDPTGAPLNLAAMKSEIADLQALRDNLQGVDGSLLRVSELEIRLKGVEDASGTGAAGGLDARIQVAVASAENRLQTDQTSRLETLRNQLTGESTRREQALDASLRSTLDSRLAAAAQTTQSLVDQSATRLRTEHADRLATALATARRDQSEATANLVASQMAAVPAQITAALDAARAGLVRSAQEAAAAQVKSSLDTSLPAVEERFQSRLNTALAVVEQNRATSESRLRTEFSSGLGRLRDDLNGSLTSRFEAFDRSVAQSLDSRVRSATDAALPGLLASTQTTIDRRLGDLDVRINRAAADATRAVPETISSQVRLELAQMDLPGQIASASAQLGEEVRSEFATALGAEQNRTSIALNAAMTQLRGETAAAVKAGTDELFTRTGTLIGSVRNELATTANTLRGDFQRSLAAESQRLSSDFSSRLSGTQLNPNVLTRPIVR